MAEVVDDASPDATPDAPVNPAVVPALADTGDRLEQIVRAVAEATDNRPLADATHVLHAELARVGLALDRDWCRNTLRALRNGQPVDFAVS